MDRTNGNRAHEAGDSPNSPTLTNVDDAILKELEDDMHRRGYEREEAEKELEYAKEKLKEKKKL